LEQQLAEMIDKQGCFDEDCFNNFCPQVCNWACTKEELRKERANYKKMKREHYKHKLLFSEMGDEGSYIWEL